MAVERSQTDTLLREAVNAEQALIEAETLAENELDVAESRYRLALEKLERAQQRVERRRREFEQARARLDQCQLERAAGPLIRRVAVGRPSLPRPARDDSRVRSRSQKNSGPTPEGADPKSNDPESGR
ncbi:MAG: hypothetical protein R2848_11555 [Thermomicrobiales bacterium]